MAASSAMSGLAAGRSGFSDLRSLRRPDLRHRAAALRIRAAAEGGAAEPDLRVTVNGLEMPNPFVIGSGPPGTNYTVMKRAFDEGWGGVIAKTPARVSLESGCEGVAAINTIMSVMGINLNTLRPEPCVEGYSTPGGYSAKAVHPIALAKVMQIGQMMKGEFNDKDYSLSAIGGVETGADAAEFILLGANTVQVCTGVMMHGYGLVKKLCDELKDFMRKHNFSSIEDFRGVSLEYFTTHTDLVSRQQEAIRQRKAVKKGLQSDKDWTGDGFVNETESMVSN